MRKIEALKEIQLEIQREIDSTFPNKKINFLLAVSGGRDSCVMLDAFYALAAKGALRFAVAHFNHGLRPESESEQDFVEKLCQSLSVECFIGRATLYDNNENLEAWARTNRYEFLEQTRQKSFADFVVTAHQKTDLAETVLMRVISGRGSIALGGIKKIDFDKKLFRPMLEIPRELVDGYVDQKGLKFVEDISNLSIERTRNKLRLELMPEIIRNFNPGLVDTLCAFSERINQDEDYIWSKVNRLYMEADTRESGLSRTDFFASKPIYFRWRLLKLELERQLGKSQVGYLAFRRLAEALESNDGYTKMIELGWGINCQFSRKGVLKFSIGGEKLK